MCHNNYSGEFSLVYKARLFNKDGEPKDVAVKTLKGLCTCSLIAKLVHVLQLDSILLL